MLRCCQLFMLSILYVVNSSCFQLFMLSTLHVFNSSCCQLSMLSTHHVFNSSCCQLFMLSTVHADNCSCCQFCMLSTAHVVNWSYGQLLMLGPLVCRGVGARLVTSTDIWHFEMSYEPKVNESWQFLYLYVDLDSARYVTMISTKTRCWKNTWQLLLKILYFLFITISCIPSPLA
jgi:hypothetical protein